MAYFLPHSVSITNLSHHSFIPYPSHISKYPPPNHSQQSILGVSVASIAASALLASNAMAIEVLFGSSDGGLAFVPSTFSMAPGEEIIFKNNAGFSHNVVYDEDKVPSGIDVAKISMSEEDLLNAPGETYKVSLNEKGTYSFYCSPYQGAGMSGKVTVNLGLLPFFLEYSYV